KALAMRAAGITLLRVMQLPRLSLLPMVLMVALLAGCAHSFDEHVTVLAAKSPYNRPVFSPGGKFAGLPPAAQNTIRAQVGVADIEDIDRDNISGLVVYKVRFRNPDAFPMLYVGANGDVLNYDLSV